MRRELEVKRERDPELHCARVKAIHDRRRKQGRCINNKHHGKAYRGGRCKPCWEQKLARERETYVRKDATP